MNPILDALPMGVIKLSDMASVNVLAGDGTVFTYSHAINSTLRAVWYLVPYAGMWFGYLEEG